jgi:hypothetical protein
MASQAWINQAYPLKQISVQVQGTRHSDRAALIALLETAVARLRAGDQHGLEHDDDFGYRFEVVDRAAGPSFFDNAAGSE